MLWKTLVKMRAIFIIKNIITRLSDRRSGVNGGSKNSRSNANSNAESAQTIELSQLFENTSTLPLTGLEMWERSIPSDQIVNLSLPPETRCWIKLASRSGYVREESLRKINGPAPNSFLLAIAVRRINDWVPQVQDAAREVLPVLVQASDPLDVVDALSATLATWISWKRLGVADRYLLIDSVQKPEMIEHFKQRIICSSSGPNSQLFSQLGQGSAFDKDLKEMALNAIQPSVRAMVFRSMLGGKISWIEGRQWKWTDLASCKGRLVPMVSERALTTYYPFIETLELAGSDRSSTVRRVAAEYLIRKIEKYGYQLAPLANRLAMDDSHSVSYRGKFALAKLEEIDS